MHNIFRFILFYRITYDPFRSIKIKIKTCDGLGFMFVERRVCKRKTLFGQPNLSMKKVLFSLKPV